MKKTLTYMKRKVRAIKSKYRVVISALLIIVAVSVFFSCTYVRALPIALQTVETVARGCIEQTIMESARAALNENESPLFSKLFDANGMIIALEADVDAINKLTAEVVENVHKNIKKMGSIKIKVPVGSTMKLDMLHGVGPEITVRGTPYVATYAHIDSVFSDAGINQTLHKMILTVSAEVTVVCADKTVSFTSESVLTVSEEVLVGSVPEGFIY